MRPIALSRVLEQSESEVRLHRALYVIKYLRAMLLNVGLLIVAGGVFVFHGTDPFFLVGGTVRSVKAIGEQLEAQGYQGQTMMLIVGTGVVVSLLGLFFWMYLSITNVWRRSLKLQASFLVISTLFAPFWAWGLLSFSFANLSPRFSAAAVVYFVFIVVMVFDMSVALWRVSGSPDTACFRATLDSALTTGPWSYLNKLLDLPRAALRTPRSFLAYFTAFGAAVLMLVCILRIMNMDEVQAKLQYLAATCHSADMDTCYQESAHLGVRVPVVVGLAIVGLKVAALLQSVAKRLNGLSVNAALKSSHNRFVLYLRPFQTDGVILPKPRLSPFSRLVSLRPFPAHIEDELFDVADGYLPLIAVGKPGDNMRREGDRAYRDYLADADWQAYVADKVDRAEAIVVVVKDTQGVRWELGRIAANRHHTKTLFFFEPAARDPAVWQRVAAVALEPLQAAGILPPGFQFQGQPLAFWFDYHQPVEIHNTNWTTTSYRTAFSTYLSFRATGVQPVPTPALPAPNAAPG
jgi:hypothetical protein